jgi:hypothetical protein
MPQLSTIIDVFLRRAGLSAGQKATLCGDLGAVPRTIAERHIVIGEEEYQGIDSTDAGKVLIFDGSSEDFSIELSFSSATAFPAGQVVTLKNLTDHTATMNIHEDVIFSGGTPTIPPGGAAQIYKRDNGHFLWV